MGRRGTPFSPGQFLAASYHDVQDTQGLYKSLSSFSRFLCDLQTIFSLGRSHADMIGWSNELPYLR